MAGHVPSYHERLMNIDNPQGIAATELYKKYGRNSALHDVSLVVPPASVAALVGRNGAGKSTLFKILAGYERPTSGVATIGGVDAWRRRGEVVLGYLPQEPSLYGRLSVAQHISLARHLAPVFDWQGSTDRLAGLGISGAQKVQNLSGGQRAQLGLILALGLRPRVLLLDEPLASLDPLARREFIEFLQRAVADVGATTIVSSHIVDDVHLFARYLVILGQGRVLWSGDVSDALATHRVLRDPANLPSDVVVVGTFPEVDGSRAVLVRCEDAFAGHSQPSLAELTMGYLSEGLVRP